MYCNSIKIMFTCLLKKLFFLSLIIVMKGKINLPSDTLAKQSKSHTESDLVFSI